MIKSSGGRVRQRQRKKALINSLRCDMIGALNSLYGVKGPGGDAEPPNRVQQSALQYLSKLGEEACRRGLARLEEASVMNDSETYLRGDSDKSLWLEANKVSLPLNEVAGSVDMLELLPEAMKARYSSGQEILINEEEVPELRKPFKGARRLEYRKLIRTLVGNGMVELRDQEPKVINGVFGVPKRDKQRLIIDARNANGYFVKPDNPELPNPGDFPQLIVKDELFFAKSDMDNFYHRLRLPRWVTTYFGLPPIDVDGIRKWPVVMTVPMGWSHSVVVAQAIHQEVLRRCGIPKELSVREGVEVGEYRYGAYIDDYFSLGTNASIARRELDKVVAKCEELGIPAKEGKVEGPEMTTMTILGFEFTREGVVRPEPERLKALIEFTTRYANFRCWRKSTLERLLGKWAWTILLKRGLFSVLEKVYWAVEGAREEDQKIKPSRAMRNELRLLCRLHMFIRADLRKPFSEVVMCTDASNHGGGVVYTRCDTDTSTRVSQKPFEESREWVKEQKWITSIKYKWKEEERIHLLEGEALVLGVRWFIRTSANHGKRLLVFVDNTALIGAIRKGRSSKPRFNRICQRVASLCLAGNVELIVRYINSDDNPADEPSRR